MKFQIVFNSKWFTPCGRTRELKYIEIVFHSTVFIGKREPTKNTTKRKLFVTSTTIFLLFVSRHFCTSSSECSLIVLVERIRNTNNPNGLKMSEKICFEVKCFNCSHFIVAKWAIWVIKRFSFFFQLWLTAPKIWDTVHSKVIFNSSRAIRFSTKYEWNETMWIVSEERRRKVQCKCWKIDYVIFTRKSINWRRKRVVNCLSKHWTNESPFVLTNNQIRLLEGCTLHRDTTRAVQIN